MVYGLDTFAEFFKGYESRYIFIGGTACELVLGEKGEEFRATKDLDIVLLAETLDASFVERFIEFIELGKYSHIRKADEREQYYRFEKPLAGADFPQMIELFSRRPEHLSKVENHLAPIHVDGALRSLSAILLDDDYYALLESGITVVEGLPVLSIEYLPVLKMKAWLELSQRKAEGEHVNTGDLSKHKNDVLRLVATFDPEQRIAISERLKSDVERFLFAVTFSDNDLRNMGIHGYSAKEMLTYIATAYEIA